MPGGGASVATYQKKEPAAAATVTAANNGLSLSGTTVVLGNDVTNAPGGIAKLLSTREIDTAAFTINLLHNQLGSNFLAKMQGDQFVFTTVALPTTSATYARGGVALVDGTGASSNLSLGSQSVTNAAGSVSSMTPTLIQTQGAAGTAALTLNQLSFSTGVAAQEIDIRQNAGVLEIRTNNATVLNASLSLTGLFAINGNGNASYVSSLTALTNGAAAALGTLTNAPVAGNPTKWIPFNDAGTTRFFPAW